MKRRPSWLFVLAALTAVMFPGCSTGERETALVEVDRVLVVSMPGVGWGDVQRGALPNLESFVADAAIADMSTRIGRRNASATDAYLTISAGTRSLAPGVDVGVAVDPADRYGGVPTAHILERRLGTPGFDGIAYLASGAARDINERSAFGGEVGLLGQTLDDAGVARAVIANADAIEGFIDEERPPDGYYARSAAAALMDEEGLVPTGVVGRGLLTDDPAAPYGTRLDPNAVAAAFDGAWGDDGRHVVLVEASDLSRARAYRRYATPEQNRALRDEALRAADDLLGELLERTDPARDAVLVISPVSPSREPALGLAALRAPGVAAEFLESATTRRAGYVQLADIAPSIISLMGEEFPSRMEGRSVHVVSAKPGDRVGHLVDAAAAARFRDAHLPAVVTAIIVLLVGIAALATVRARLPKWMRTLLPTISYGALGIIPGTFLAGQFGFAHDSLAGHAAAVVLVAVLVAAVATLVERVRRGLGLLVAAGSPVLLLSVDVLFSAPLQMNTMFGYSVAVAGRFTGLGNLAYALLGAAAIVTASLAYHRYGRRALLPAGCMLVAVVLVDGLPMLGADVGGVLSLIPAFGVTLLILAGSRIRWQQVAGLVAAAGVTVLTFAFIDAARPSETHTHLARLAEHVLDGRWNLLGNIVHRRWEASFGSLDLAGWGTVIVALVLAATYAELQIRRGRGQRDPWEHVPLLSSDDVAIRAAVAGLVVLGVAGLVVNDSSVAVPFTLLIVAAPAYLAYSTSTEAVPNVVEP